MVSTRIVAIDAARGCAMVLVCLSHIKHHFEAASPNLYSVLLTLTRAATPAFLLLSGFVIAVLLRTDPRGNAAFSLIDRGIFLLVIAHLLLDLSTLPQVSAFDWLYDRGSLTDAIGVALFFAVALRSAPALVLFVLGTSACVLSWIFFTMWVWAASTGHSGSILMQLGTINWPWGTLPVIPYVGMFLIGMGLSVQLQRPLIAGEHKTIARRLTNIGFAALLAVALGIVAWAVGNDFLPGVFREDEIRKVLGSTFDPRSKNPPSPAYLMFYGGGALVLLAMVFNGRPAWLIRTLTTPAAVLGRASLMCYVVQDWLFFLLPSLFGYDTVRSTLFWWVYFTISLVSLYMLAKAWGAVRGNRFLTVGLKAIANRRAVRAPANAA